MKKIFAVLVFLLFAASAHAQLEVGYIYNNNKSFCGMKDRFGKWVVQPKYINSQQLRDGYVAFKDADYHWGVLGPNGEQVVPFEFDDHFYLGDHNFLPVKKNGYYGLIAYKENIVVLPFRYTEIATDNSGVYGRYWNSATCTTESMRYSKEEMQAFLDQLKTEKRQREIATITRKQQEAARKQKEEELSSFTTYAKNYVEPKVNAWQQKGEFETTDEYSKRVTGPNRFARIEDLTSEAEQKFIAEHTELNKAMRFTLGLYDADNETFKLTSAKFGDFFLRVPRAEAPDFKQRFTEYTFADPTYYISDDRIAIGGFALKNVSGKTYTYDKGQKAAYATYEIAYDKFDFQPISSTVEPDGVAQQAQKSVVLQGVPAVKPVLTILSPANGDSYTQKEVVIRYSVRSGDSSIAEVKVYIDGESYDQATAKGVKQATDEIVLPLPQRPGAVCRIDLEVINSYGYSATEKLFLHYTGDKQKPRLHLLSVGVGDYADAGIPKLRQAAKDASDFAAAVTTRPNTQYSRVNAPVVLTDRAATAAGIKSALVKLAREAEQDDVVMLFFSGHGAEEGRKVYFLPSDAEKDNYFTTGVKFDDIRDMMDNLVAKQCRVVVFMDTCHSGAMFNTKGANDNFTIASPDVVGFYSSTRSEKSNESEKWSNGIFTKALIEGINGAAADAQQRVTIQELDNYVKKVVDRETQGRQSPIVENRVGDFILF